MNDDDAAATRLRFALVSAVVALSLLGDALLYALLPAKPGEFGIRIWQVGILLGANRFVRLLTNELAGRLIENRGGRGPLLAAVIVGSLITACYALPIGFWGLLCARLLWGACWSVLRVEGYMSALAYATDQNRGRIFAVYQAAVRVGQGGGLLIGGFLSEILGIPYTFGLFGIISICGLIPLGRAPRKLDDPSTQPTAGSRTTADRVVLPRPRRLIAARSLFRNWPLGLWGCGLCLTMTEQMIANLTGRFVAHRIGGEIAIGLGIASLSGLLLSFRSFVSLMLGPLAGALSDRIGRKPLMGCLVVLQCLCIAGLAFLKPWHLVIACLLLQFVAGISARLLIYTIAGDLAPDSGKALHMSRFATFTDLGTALGPMVGFALFAAHGFLPVAVIGWALLLAVLTFLAGTFKSGS